MNNQSGPKILLVDIETAPIMARVWGLFDQNISLNMIEEDWHLLSWSAKWFHDDDSKIMYMDQRNEKDITNDKKLLKGIWPLLDEADIVVGQNSKRFDVKKLNARFILNGFGPPSPFKQIDTLQLAKKYFAFTSNKLEYLSDKLCIKYKKQIHRIFSGYELWKECLKGNIKAWIEMEKYNKYDVLSLQEVFKVFEPWDHTINYNLYKDANSEITCNCGSSDIERRGFTYTATSKYQRFKCNSCGAWSRGNKNMIEKDRRDLFKKKIT